jgi:16S rRNA (cytosine967-C5)-methyltransferase
MQVKKETPRSRPKRLSPARTAAFDVLMRIELEGAYSSVLLPQYTERLEPRDRGLCYEITLGVLRRKLHLDRLIDQRTKDKKIDPAIRTALRIGLYQLIYLDKIPAHSAIDESVELAAYAKKVSAKGFVNAVLRGISRDGTDIETTDGLDRAVIETSHPRWLIEHWAKDFGEQAAIEIARANNSVGGMAFRFTPRAGSREAPVGSSPSKLVEGCFIAEHLTDELRQLADNGEIYCQDEASQMVGRAAMKFHGGSFLDVCAAPGSKFTQVAADGSFESVVAGDIHSHRVRHLKANAQKQGVSGARILACDAENELPFAEDSFDVVLVDAPCSGTGTIRHNPEIRYNLRPEHLLELQLKQRRILENASKMVRTGGKLIYSTCSLERAENEAVIDIFLKSNPGWRTAAPAVDEQFVTSDGFARTFPHVDDMDGFFIAVLEKTDA